MKPFTRRGLSLTFSVLAGAWLLSGALPARAEVWLADGKTLKRIDLATDRVTVSVSLDTKPKALAVDPHNDNLWVLAKKRLFRFDATGAQLQEIDLRSLSTGLEEPKHLALNPYDGSLWLGAERSVLSLDREGTKRIEWQTPQEIEALALDADESLWVLTHRHLLHYSAAGKLLGSAELNSLMGEAEHIAVDSLGSILWVASHNVLHRFNLLDLAQAPQTVVLPTAKPKEESSEDGDANKPKALAVHPLFGTLWIVTQQHLLLFDRQGSHLKTVELGQYGLAKAEVLAFDSGSASLWLAAKASIARFTGNGEFVARIVALDAEAEALTATPFLLQPTLSLLAPADGALTNNPAPAIRLRLGSDCNQAPCVLPPAYYDSMSLDAALNGQAIGPFFNRAQTDAVYLPPARLPEGPHTLSALASDLFGHKTSTVTSRFTIDTIPPKFLGVIPADGSQHQSATVTISGSIDDPNGNVSLFDGAGAILGMGSANFSFLSNLRSGENRFSLLARDPAGNEAQFPLRLTYNLGGLQILNLQSGATVSGTTVSVIGTFSGPPGSGVTVNGVAATVVGNKFVANVPLVTGENTLTIVVTSPDGEVERQTVTVHGNGAESTVLVESGLVSGPVVYTVAGDGSFGFSVDGVKAAGASVAEPVTVAWSPGGLLHFADYSRRVRQIDSSGALKTVAGTDGDPRRTGDGGPATLATFDYIKRIAFGPDGSLYVLEGPRVRRVGPDGVVTTVAGTDRNGYYTGDGGPAVEADFSTPEGLAVGPDSALYIADTGNHVIRRVDVNGIVTTIAGSTGGASETGDGVLATNADLYRPNAITLGKDGSIYLAECYIPRVRRIAPDGRIYSFAGTGEWGYSGDGGPAAQATLSCPADMAFDVHGNLLVADSGNGAIRRIDASGNISTIAGTGFSGFNGDGGVPTGTLFNWPASIALSPNGTLHIADSYNHRVRAFDLSLVDGPTAGMVSLKLNPDPGTEIARIEIDFDGDGTIDLVTTDLTAPWLYRYPAPGIYEARITLIDKAGNRREIRHTVVVRDTAAMDATLKAVYAGMLTRLRVQNIDGALNYISGGMREKYRAVFEALKANLSAVVDQLGVLQGGAIGEEMAEYAIVRSQGGQPRAFLIYFLRGEDGVWRIDGM